MAFGWPRAWAATFVITLEMMKKYELRASRIEPGA
jgi:hypothetical protein